MQTTSPFPAAPETDEVPGAADPSAHGSGERQPQEDPTGSDTPRPPATTRQRIVRWAGDVLAAALLAAVFVWLADHDGGKESRALLYVAGLALVAAPWALAEVRRLPRLAQILLGTWAGGGLLSIAFAGSRSFAVEPALTIGLTAIVGLVTLRLWRRRWGPGVVVGILLVAFGAYWYRSFLQWWGDAMLGREAQWMSLSWWNQSGILMGAFGLVFAGVALLGRRLTAVGAGLLTSMALAGTWLSGSRGAPLFTAAALVVVVIVTLRARGWRSAAARTTALLAGTVATVLALTVFAAGSGGSGGQPIGQRDQSAGHNAAARLEHMAAGARMFVADPLTGHGLGSYREIAPAYTSPEGNLTASAHNEYVEAFAEGGLLTGGALLGLVAGLALLVLRRMRRVPDIDTGARGVNTAELRHYVCAGAAGAATLIAVHAAFDFDFGYPVLPALLAVAAAILVAEVAGDHRPAHRDHERRRVRPWIVALPVAVLLAVGILGGVVEEAKLVDSNDLAADEYANAFAPWDAQTGQQVALILSERGEQALARDVIERTIAYNPGVPQVHVVDAIVAYRAGQASAEDVAATLELRRTPFWAFNLAARNLIRGGDLDAAEDILLEARDAYPRFTAWGVIEVQEETEQLLDEIASRRP